MHIGLFLDQSLEQRQELRHVIRLSHELTPPTDWSWPEPEPMTKLQRSKGKVWYSIKEDELKALALATQKASDILWDERPDLLYVSARGGLPTGRAIRKLLAGRAAPEYYKEARTSYFLSNLTGNIERSLAGPEVQSIAFIDTSVTGTKHSWFLPQFYEALNETFSNQPMRLIQIIFRHNWDESISGGQQHGNVDVRTYSIGVPNLIAEDTSGLLGYTFRKDQIDPKAYKFMDRLTEAPRAEIRVQTNSGEKIYQPFKGEFGTATRFVNLLVQYARRYK